MALTALAGAWVLGLVLGLRWDVPHPSLLLWAGAALALWGLLRLRLTPRNGSSPGASHRLLWALLSVLALLLGIWWAGSPLEVDPELGPEEFIRDGVIVIRGRVVSDPQLLGTAYRFRLETERVMPRGSPEAEGREVLGPVQVTLRPTAALVQQRERPHVRYGDVLLLEGRLETPPRFADFDYREYLARQGIHALMSFPRVTLQDQGQGAWALERVYDLRHRLAESLQQNLPEPQAATAQALLLGLRQDLPSDVREDFLRTGTGHLLAISGLHVGVLLGVLLATSTLLLGGSRWALLLPLGGLWLYALLSGMAPPVVRASIMGSLYLGSRFFGRPGGGLPALAAAAGVMAGLNPQILKDVSFQLSFIAMASLILLTPRLEEWLNAVAARRLLEEGFPLSLARAFNATLAVSTAATIGTLPLIAFTFHRVSLVGIPTTLLTLPALPPILVGSAGAAALGLLWHPLGVIAGWIAWAPLSYLLELVRLFDTLPGITFDVGWVAPAAVFAYYGGLLLLLARRPVQHSLTALSPRLQGFRVSLRWAAPPLVVAAILLWGSALAAPEGKLHVTFIDVGQGDAIFIRSPSGRQVLVDGGPDPRLTLRALGDRMPFWDRSLDVVVLTHPHQDHLAGLPDVLRRYRVDLVVQRTVEYPSAQYVEWRPLLAEMVPQTSVLEAVARQEVHLGDGVVLRVLHPGPIPIFEEVNNDSVVIHLTYGEVAFLLTGDIDAAAETALLARGVPLDATVLKVAHHGSRSSTISTFLAAVTPEMAVISVGAENRFDHPHEETFERLWGYIPKERVLLTSERGNIEFTTDGRRIWMDTQR